MRIQGKSSMFSCFVLFIVLCLSLHVNGEAFVYTSAQPGLLLFVIPGAVSVCGAKHHRVTPSFIGALLALPVCLALMELWFISSRSFWQQLAWLSSGLFWCGFGAMGAHFVCSLSRFQGKHRASSAFLNKPVK